MKLTDQEIHERIKRFKILYFVFADNSPNFGSVEKILNRRLTDLRRQLRARKEYFAQLRQSDPYEAARCGFIADTTETPWETAEPGIHYHTIRQRYAIAYRDETGTIVRLGNFRTIQQARSEKKRRNDFIYRISAAIEQ